MAPNTSQPALEEMEIFRLGAHTLLPALCPACGAPGVHPFDIPVLHGAYTPHPLVEHYCDLCASARQRSSTLYVAWLLASMLAAAAIGTALMLWFSPAERSLQFLLLLGLSLALGLVALRFAPTRERWELNLELPQPAAAPLRTLATSSPFIRRALHEAGATVVRGQLDIWIRKLLPRASLVVFPLCVGLCCWILLQHEGTTSLRLLNGGDQDLYLVVDDVLMRKQSPQRFEDPRSGQQLILRAGRHKVTLLREDGTLVSNDEVVLAPQGQWVVGQLAAEHCLFLEELDYGAESELPVRASLDFRAGALQLPQLVDSWFIPLGARDADQWNAGSPSGRRRALRLMPCSAR